jgi:hypothetical protein
MCPKVAATQLRFAGAEYSNDLANLLITDENMSPLICKKFTFVIDN